MASTRVDDSFPRFAARQTWLHMLWLAIACLVSTVVLWPLDFLWFSDPVARAGAGEARLLLFPICLVSVLLVWKLRFAQLHSDLLFLFCGGTASVVAGYAMAHVGGIERPLALCVYLIPFSSIPLILPLARRVLLTLAVTVLFFAGFFWIRPAEMHSPWLPMILAVEAFGVIASAVIGWMLYRLVYEEHAAEFELGQRQRALDAAGAQALHSHNERIRLNASLEERVSMRTETVRALVGSLDLLHEEERREAASALKRALAPALAEVARGLREEPIALGPLFDAVDGALSATRQVITQLRPVWEEETALERAAPLLIEKFSAGLPCSYEIEKDGRAPRALLRTSERLLAELGRSAGVTALAISFGPGRVRVTASLAGADTTLVWHTRALGAEAALLKDDRGWSLRCTLSLPEAA